MNRPIPLFQFQCGVWELTGNSVAKTQIFPTLGKPRCPVAERSHQQNAFRSKSSRSAGSRTAIQDRRRWEPPPICTGKAGSGAQSSLPGRRAWPQLRGLHFRGLAHGSWGSRGCWGSANPVLLCPPRREGWWLLQCSAPTRSCTVEP